MNFNPSARYQPQEIEAKWQRRWAERGLFATRWEEGRRKYYYLDMFPYPSGNLHVGHVRNYTIGDLIARYHYMRGANVLHPMGWDAFGLPAENAAIKHKVHPREWTQKCIARMRQQLGQLGFSFDWGREINTCEPEYYRWTQWLFLQFYRRGLAYRRLSPVNWCPSCQTVLANEQVHGGACERCGTPVVKRQFEQWFFKTTAYAQQLLDDLELLEHWPERVKVMQRNWIGRSEGVEFKFALKGKNFDLPVFTTRIDTVYGVTYVVLAPEYPDLPLIVEGTGREAEVEAFVQRCLAQSEAERAAATLEKEGIFTGTYAVHPLTQEEVPIWVANYVLMEYGTGAIMAVPAHDQRDFEFAQKYNLPIRVVINPPGGKLEAETMIAAYEEDGFQVNSGPFDAMPNREAMEAIADYMEERGIGQRQVNYRLRDWCLSRQRYWGCPIPIIYCDECGIVPVPEEDLPVLLPEEVEFRAEGGNPLAQCESFVHTTCPQCGQAARRETDTMDTFVDSSWYFLRYASPHAQEAPFAKKEIERWLPVDQYVGGIEHATMHLIYARFFTKVLYDLGLVPFREPFTRLFTQGMICKETFLCPRCYEYFQREEIDEEHRCPQCGAELERRVEKMSKSIGNIVTADEVREKYGADTARVYILFVGPPDQDAEWSDQGVEGVYRFLNRVWRLVAPRTQHYLSEWREQLREAELTPEQQLIRRRTHQTIHRVTRDLERFSFNTAVSRLMELVNAVLPFAQENLSQPIVCAHDALVFSEAVENLLLLLSPFAPHIADELWERLGKRGSTYLASWPEADPEWVREEEITIVVQVNGKLRDRLLVPADISEEELKARALASPKVRRYVDGKEVRRIVVVPRRLVNIVV